MSIKLKIFSNWFVTWICAHTTTCKRNTWLKHENLFIFIKYLTENIILSELSFTWEFERDGRMCGKYVFSAHSRQNLEIQILKTFSIRKFPCSIQVIKKNDDVRRRSKKTSYNYHLQIILNSQNISSYIRQL